MAGGEKKKKPKQNDGAEEVVEMDRLSDLPDRLVLHILSFISDTNFCVQTSLVSKRWKNLWTCLPDLIFDRYDRYNLPAFMKFVRLILCRRENIPVRKFRFEYLDIDRSYVGGMPRLLNYAMSHNVQHVSLYLGFAVSLTLLFPLLETCRSLKTLELVDFKDLHLLKGFTIPCLTTLDLNSCNFCDEVIKPTPIDPFVGLFNMKSLKLLGGNNGRNLKISGPQLDSLRIVTCENCNFEIVAPNLRFFTFHHESFPVKFPDLSFPLLEITDMVIDGYKPFDEMEKFLVDMINMFCRLYHVRSLVLTSDIIEGLMECPGVLEDRASPFVRLKTLKVIGYGWPWSTFKISDNVMKYFGENITVEKF